MQKNYNENLVAGAAIRDDKGRRISKLFESPHPKMTVGYAKNLIMPNDPTEQEFNFRQSGGGVIEDGVAVIDKVKGNSVVWNQLIPMKASGTTETINGVTITYTDNGFRLQGTATNTFRFTTLGTCNLKEGHKYLTFGGSSGTSLQIELWGGNPIDSRKGQPAIVTISTTPTALGIINIYCFGEEIFVGEELHWQFCDLTQMFGAENEPSTYEEFLQRKPNVADEYAYNEGTIINNKIEAVETIGINLFNNKFEAGSFDVISGQNKVNSNAIRTKEYVPIIPNTKMYAGVFGGTPQSLWIMFFDENKNMIEGYTAATPQSGNCSDCLNKIFTTPSNGYFMRFYIKHDIENICINLSDPTINGQYFPYEKHELDLSWVKDIKDAEGVKLFEDGMRSAGTAFDEVRKNKAVKRIGVVDLGTLDWRINGGGDGFYCNEILFVYSGSVNVKPNILCGIYETKTLVELTNGTKGISVLGTNKIWIKDSVFSDAQSFKAAMSGIMLYYELAEPIEVEYDEKNLTYPVAAGGTEKAIASEPSTAFLADIGYGIDAVKTILDLKARVEALEGK